MDRDQALQLLKSKLKNQNLFKHSLAVEAIMRAVAERFDEDVELFGTTGLLHDIDYETTADKPDQHSLIGARMLEEEGLPPEVVYAVKVHNHVHGLPRLSLMDKALYAADPVSGFIIAGALIKPEKSLAAIDVDFLMNRFKEKSFARGANRETMAACSEFGLSLEEFLDISLKACQSIHAELGL